MACFIIPAVEAVAGTILQKKVGREKAEKMKLGWLNTMLWGGVALLAIEHIWHGEVVPWPPFLTAMANPAETSAMIKEMAIVGTAMAIVVTLAWVALVFITNALSKRIFIKKTAKL